MDLAREDRPKNIAALASIRDHAAKLVEIASASGLCPKGLGEVARVGVEAGTLLARYSDGDPGAANVPKQEASEGDDLSAVLEELRKPLSPELEETVDATVRREGGDAGGAGEGNGGGA